jgi:hypothetical protein
MENVYLTAPEQKLFSQFDDVVRKKYTVVSETAEGFETPKEMEARLNLLAGQEYGEVQKAAHDICERLAKTGELDELPADMTEGSIEALLFLIGAHGLTDMIITVLRTSTAAEAADAAATLSVIRHALLETNLAGRA